MPRRLTERKLLDDDLTSSEIRRGGADFLPVYHSRVDDLVDAARSRNGRSRLSPIRIDRSGQQHQAGGRFDVLKTNGEGA